MMHQVFRAEQQQSSRSLITLPCGHELTLPTSLPLSVLPGPVYDHLARCEGPASDFLGERELGEPRTDSPFPPEGIQDPLLDGLGVDPAPWARVRR